jgi:Transglycosylase-like domain
MLALALGFAAPAQAPRERHRTEAERAFRRAVGDELQRLHRVQARLRAAVGRGVPEPLRKLIAVVACESNWQPGVVSADGRYEGLGQFDASTWRSTGGRGSPAAASPAEQLGRMLLLVAARGWQPWPYCGRLW